MTTSRDARMRKIIAVWLAVLKHRPDNPNAILQIELALSETAGEVAALEADLERHIEERAEITETLNAIGAPTEQRHLSGIVPLSLGSRVVALADDLRGERAYSSELLRSIGDKNAALDKCAEGYGDLAKERDRSLTLLAEQQQAFVIATAYMNGKRDEVTAERDELRLELRAAVGDQEAMIEGFVYDKGAGIIIATDGSDTMVCAASGRGWMWRGKGSTGIVYDGPRKAMRAALAAAGGGK